MNREESDDYRGQLGSRARGRGAQPKELRLVERSQGRGKSSC